MRKFIAVALFYALVLWTLPVIPAADAQVLTTFGGEIKAADFAYGLGPSQALQVGGGGGTSGSYALTLNFGKATTVSSGIPFYPFAGAPFPYITIGSGATLETVQVTSATCGPGPADQYQQCSITATFTNAHGAGDVVRSGDAGLQEAVNYAYSKGGGQVDLDQVWAQRGGTATTIANATVYPSVYLQSLGVTFPSNLAPFPAGVFWTPQATTVSLISAPTTLTSSTVTQPASCPTGATCSWTAAEPDFCIAYVDIQGQLSACSTAYAPSSNLTASLPVTITAPAASAGAVGWVAFAGTSSSAMYNLPLTSAAGVPLASPNTVCTLTMLETVYPACALTNTAYNQTGSSGTWNAIYVNTNQLFPLAASSSANVANPVYQAHTAFAYVATQSFPYAYATAFSLSPANTASQSSTNVATVQTYNLPLANLNNISRRIRVRGKVAATVTSAGTPTVIVALGWIGGYSSGAPTAVCTIAGGATTTGTSVLLPFECTLTVEAVGTTAVGNMTADGWSSSIGSGAAIPGVDSGTSAGVGSLGLFSYAQLYIEFEDNGQASTACRLLDSSVETIL